MYPWRFLSLRKPDTTKRLVVQRQHNSTSSASITLQKP